MHSHLPARWAKVALPPLAIILAGTAAWTFGPRDAKPKRAAPFCSAQVDVAAVIANDPQVLLINSEIDSVFAATVAQVRSAPPTSQYGRVTLLGKLLLNDKTLSVNKNVACETCHAPAVAQTGSVDIINRTIVAYPGSAFNLVSARKPQTYRYGAAFAPILHYDEARKTLAGGNFWDMRATGIALANPAADQGQGPPLNPVEMALPDAACVVYRISRGPYRALFERTWGAQSFAINWPTDVERVCSTPAPAPANDSLPVHLTPIDRGTAVASYNSMALAMATYEASPEISPFSSKFDSALANPDRQILTPDEQAGWTLFRGKGNCNTCHLDGTDNRSGTRTARAADRITPASAADQAPLFTDFTAVNIGLPRNPGLRFYCENTPSPAGYTPNPAGARFVDRGVGAFLRSPGNPNPAWTRLADKLDGAMRVPTVRNVDMRPRPDFVKAYMHNGYLKSLKEVVHFYNTRDVLPRCQGENAAGEKVSCWPAPEVATNVDTTIVKLGMTPHEEDLIVAFLKTLTDAPPRPETPRRRP
ncbi:MAG: putative methylamine utilization protein MauG [Gemmatimonadetes bacterium]|nr:putative methylamine utilization protein MauG [Gemmatimonadota bacterium]